MQQGYPLESNGKPDNCKSSMSLSWEEIYGSPIDLPGFAESYWNTLKPVEIDASSVREEQNEKSELSKPHLKDSGTSSLNDEDPNSITDKDGQIASSETPVSVKTIVQQFSQRSNGISEKNKWQLVIKELIDSEKVYLKSLIEVEDGYLGISKEIFTEDKEVMIIFSNWKELRVFHSKFLNQLKSVKTYDFHGLQQLAQCFICEVQQFEALYTEYCINYSQSIKHLHHIESTSTNTWQSLILCQTHLGHQLPLSTFLLKPIQRILKYHLLLKELVECCKLIQHPGITFIIGSLIEAFESMVKVANSINEKQMEREQHLRRLQIRDELYSQLLSIMLDYPDLGKPYLDGILKVPGCKNSRLVLLCQNALVLAKRLSVGKWDIKQVIQCNQMMLFEYIPKQPLEFHVVDINDNKNKATLQATNTDDKESWCKMIKQLIISTFEMCSISERAKRILLDKKCNVLAQNQVAGDNDLSNKYHVSLNTDTEDDFLDSTLRKYLDPIPPSLFIPHKHKSVKRRNSVGAIKSESKINFRDPSIYQWSSRRQYRNDEDIDCRSIMIDVNEENLSQTVEMGGSSHYCCNYDDKSTSSKIGGQAPEVPDLSELSSSSIQTTSTNASNISMVEIEMASLCSDHDLDSITSETATPSHQHKHKSTSMDRNFGVSLYSKTNSFTSSTESGNPSSADFSSNTSHRKKPLFSSVRETKTARSNSEWGSLFDAETKSGLVRRFFRASAKLAKRDKSKLFNSQDEHNNNVHVDNGPLDDHKLADMIQQNQAAGGGFDRSPTAGCQQHKRVINKSNSSDFIGQPQHQVSQGHKSNCSRKANQKSNVAPVGVRAPVLDNITSQLQAGLLLNDDSHKPSKPPRQLPHFRIEMFDKSRTGSAITPGLHVVQSDSHIVNNNESEAPLSSSSEATLPPFKVKDLVSMFQLDR